MSSLHKTFASGESIKAAEVNNALNPTVADHIPYAVAAGTIAANFTAQNVNVAGVSFPPGRFTVAPIVTVAPTGTSATVARPTGITTAGCGITTWTPSGNNITENQVVCWQAVQMTPTSAAG